MVYVPFGWDRFVRSDLDLLSLHDELGARMLDVGGRNGAGFAQRRARHEAEDAGEDLRLLYVALTRAECQTVTWWAPTANTRASALHRLLLGRPAPGQTPDDSYPVPDDRTVLDRLCGLSTPDLAVEPVAGAAPTGWASPADRTPAMAAARFNRHLGTDWRRTSYSRLITAAHGAGAGRADARGVGSEPDSDVREDEAMPPPALPPNLGDIPALPSPMADLPTGATFGTVVHAVLETSDPTAPDLLGELTARSAEQLSHRSPRLDAHLLAAALVPTVRTPLGPLVDDRCLADFAPADRLTEVDFEYPLDGGDGAATAGDLTLAGLARLLDQHLPAGDPLAAYPDRLAAVEAHRLRGYLAGSIGAVLRVPGSAGSRYIVVDYKTNWLGGIGPTGPEPLTTRHYHPTALAQAMASAHYPLQALLYCVALHRYLRWRQRGYDPHRHLGGVLYLFLRGMCGPDTPTVDGVPCGVFSWQPPAALVTDLSRLLDGGSP